ncbi:MAG: hypothetical protein E7B11_07155 [Clostridiales bacterium]|uniref:hypothetical protein n=1 Tax=Robinsoniella sp. TaxID=2496533 RepID=UPI00290EC9CB|nr:hypothetical protein [Clostridiales bacterium]MDU3240331.1 hypothetical protein [Clostridiales bacterium]
MMKNNSALFFTCSLIEYIGRIRKLRRDEVVDYMGKDVIERIYRYADVLHCEPIEKTADEYINMNSIPEGDYDNVGECKYEVPDYWTIGEVYERLIEDIPGNNNEIVEKLIRVYKSWLNQHLSNYNSDLYYQSREYIAECYKSNQIL